MCSYSASKDMEGSGVLYDTVATFRGSDWENFRTYQ